MAELVVTIVTSLMTLIGVCVTAWAGAKKTRDEVTRKLETAQAVTDCKLEALTREVRAHNNFASRVPVLEAQMQENSRRISVLEQE